MSNDYAKLAAEKFKFTRDQGLQARLQQAQRAVAQEDAALTEARQALDAARAKASRPGPGATQVDVRTLAGEIDWHSEQVRKLEVSKALAEDVVERAAKDLDTLLATRPTGDEAAEIAERFGQAVAAVGTHVLGLRGALEALEQAGAEVERRYGGTPVATRGFGSALRDFDAYFHGPWLRGARPWLEAAGIEEK